MGRRKETLLKDGASAIFEQMPVGAYVAQEEALAGFNLREITCVEDGVANSVAEVGKQQALINLEPGETVMRTFINGQTPWPDRTLNLIPWVDSAVQSVSRWTLSSGTFLPTASRQNDGSGSISLSGTTIVKGPSVSVAAGEVYTCGVYYQSDATPTTLRVRLKVWGDGKREASGAKNWLFATPGEWGVATFVFEAQPGDHTIRLFLARPRKPANRHVPMRVDDAFCVMGYFTPGG